MAGISKLMRGEEARSDKFGPATTVVKGSEPKRADNG